MEYWKYKAKDKLENYLAQKASLITLSEEIANLESEAYSIKSATSDGTPVKGGGNGREDRLLSNIVQREEYKLLLDRAQTSVDGIERGLAVLNQEERHLLDVAYIARERGYLKRLMNELGLQETTSVYKPINKALLRFTVAMYGGTES